MAARKQPFEILYDDEVAMHVLAIERRYHNLIRKTIVEKLRFEPEVETRIRKPLVRPSAFGTAWELHFGPKNSFRVFYRVGQSPREVHILAIGVKFGNRLFVGG